MRELSGYVPKVCWYEAQDIIQRNFVVVDLVFELCIGQSAGILVGPTVVAHLVAFRNHSLEICKLPAYLYSRC